MNISKTLFITLCAIVFQYAFSVEKITTEYNIDDLKILSTNKEYIEFFDHMYDIRPSLRDNTWRELVSKNINEFLKKIIETKNFSRKNVEIILKLNKLDLIQNDEILTLYSNDVFKGYLFNCATTTPGTTNSGAKINCLKNTLSFWNESNFDDDLAFIILESTKSIMSSKDITDIASIEFLKNIDQEKILTYITEGKNAPQNCQRPLVQTALLNKLYKIYIASPELALDFNYFSRNCFNAMRARIDKLIYSSNDIDRKVAYKILDSTKEMKAQDKHLYYLTYLLDSPEKGEELNNAWAIVEELAKDHKSREELINKFSHLDMIPDNLFKNDNPELTKGITVFLANKFPEFIDYYYSQCLAYYQASEKFPKGTRTLNCREFLEVSKDKSILTQIQINKIKMALPNKNI